MLFDGIVLKCSLHIEEERTTAGILHLLNGKRSVQTVQDARIYQLERFYGVYQKLTKQAFDKKINELLTKGLLTLSSSPDTDYKPTKLAQQWIKENKSNLPFAHFQGLKYFETGPIFLQRLLLLIQTLTNSKMRNFIFIPVIDKSSIIEWVRSTYKQMKPFENKTLPMLYDEIYTLLSYLPDQQAELFVDRLTGFKHYGMSMEQLSMTYGIDANNIQLLYIGITHHMLDTIIEDSLRFPIMAFIMKDLSSNGFITSSAQKTYGLIKKQYTINQIADIRQLKQNTIYDHIVEIALYDTNFPIRNYVEKHTYQAIIHAVKQTNSFKLKQLKEKVSEDISYFQIRLTLATTKNSLKPGD